MGQNRERLGMSVAVVRPTRRSRNDGQATRFELVERGMNPPSIQN